MKSAHLAWSCRLFHAAVTAVLVLTALGHSVASAAERVSIGSKSFTESVVLGEILQQLAGDAGAQADHLRQMGGTRILWEALLSGEIDAYPEYTGTLVQEILKDPDVDGDDGLREALAVRGLRMSPDLGFNNSYAIGMRRQHAAQLGLRHISDLREQPDLVLGFGNEFLDRADGWRGLQRHYSLPQTNVRGMDHDLAYRGLASGALDVTDLYTTDAEIAFYDLIALADDSDYFPTYQAVIVYRADLQGRLPGVVTAFSRLAGRIDAAAMSAMNARVKIDGVAESRVAADFLAAELEVQAQHVGQSAWAGFWRNTREHLTLVGISLSAAILFAVPLGVAASRNQAAGRLILSVAGILQTIPSLALFVFMIPLLGIGGPPAVAALFLYSLLPIIQNTHAGIEDIPSPIVESAAALGLPGRARLRLVELPLATRSILAGIKTSAVINVGTATLAALIGAGGYGQPILTGIRLADTGLILQGAVPAAAMALVVQGGFAAIERRLLPAAAMDSNAV